MLYGVRVACFILLVQYSSNFMYGRRFALKSAYYGMGAVSASILSNGVTGNNKKFVLCQPLHSSVIINTIHQKLLSYCYIYYSWVFVRFFLFLNLRVLDLQIDIPTI